MVRLEGRYEHAIFDLHEIVAEVMSATSTYPEATVRTHVTSVMCSNAPVHHANLVPHDDVGVVSVAPLW